VGILAILGAFVYYGPEEIFGKWIIDDGSDFDEKKLKK